jgi:hypothetical protein
MENSPDPSSPAVEGIPRRYPLVICDLAIENGHRNSGFTWIYPLKMVIFHRFLLIYQRVFLQKESIDSRDHPQLHGEERDLQRLPAVVDLIRSPTPGAFHQMSDHV